MGLERRSHFDDTRRITRLLNLALVGLVVGLIVGAVYLGRTVRDDAATRLTQSIPASAAAATADAQLRTAIFAANAYFLRHSTYDGMTADALRAEVDAGVAPGISIAATAAGFCVETSVGEWTFSYRVRSGFPTPGSGC